jgi:hypothetical protein
MDVREGLALSRKGRSRADHPPFGAWTGTISIA